MFIFVPYPLEEEIAIHSSNLAWKIPWIEDPGGLLSMERPRVRHDLESEHIHTGYETIMQVYKSELKLVIF